MADTWMFEVYYRGPLDPLREARISQSVTRHGGKLDFHEGGDSESGPVILTFEFLVWDALVEAAKELRAVGEHVEICPGPYGTAS